MKLFNTVSQRTELARDSLTGLDVLIEDIRVVIFCELMSVDLSIIYLFGVLRVKKKTKKTYCRGHTVSAQKGQLLKKRTHSNIQYIICNYAQGLWFFFFFSCFYSPETLDMS